MATIPNRYLPGQPGRSLLGGGGPWSGTPAAPPPKGKPGRASRMDRQRVIHTAVTSVANELANTVPGLDQKGLLNLARVILTRPGVQIGRKGTIFYHGQAYKPAAFADSPLAKLASGQTATARNQAAIQGSPDYIQALATLGLNRDQSLAGLDDQQRQALIQFGDPTYAQGDPTTQGAALANPFSTERLARSQYDQNASAAMQNANRAGVLQGGGEISGQSAAQRSYAGTLQDAVTKLQALLGAVAQQRSSTQQAYGVGQSQASLDAYNSLLASGYHAAAAPKWGVGTFAVRGYGGGGGGKSGGFGAPPPRNLPGGATGVTGTPGQGYNPGPMPPPGRIIGGGRPGFPIGGLPPSPPQPLAAGTSPMASELLRRYGLNVG